MRYILRDGNYIPKNCLYGPRPMEGLVLNPREWASVNERLYSEQRKQELAEAEVARQEAKRNKSWEMSARWENSIASIKLSSEKKRLAKVEAEEQRKLEEYNEIQRQREEVRQQVLEEARKQLLEEQHSKRRLNTALRMCGVLYEREKQVEFSKKQKERIRKQDETYAESIRKGAEEFEEDKYEEQLLARQKKLKFREVISEQIAEKRQREDPERKKAIEKIELKQMKIELDKILSQEKKNRIFHKERIRYDIDKYKREKEECLKQRQLEDEEEEQIRQIFVDVSNELMDRRKIVERNTIQNAIEVCAKQTEKIAELLKGTKKLANEEARMERLREENEEKELKAVAERKEKKRKLIEELKEGEIELEKKLEEEALMKMEEMKLELIQKQQTEEINKEWKKLSMEAELEKKRKVKETLLEQCRENHAKRLQERREEIETARRMNAKDDTELFKNCDFAMDYAKKNGLPLFPVVRAIKELKEEIECPKILPIKFLQSRVPIESVKIYAKPSSGLEKSQRPMSRKR